MPRPPLLSSVLASAALALAALAASVLAPTMALAADAPPAIAWTVETVDGAQGAGRPNFSYAVDPGATLTDTMRVTNTGATALDLAVYAADAYTTPSGNIDLNTTDAPSVDAGTWVVADVAALSLQPGQQADVAFTVTVPADAAPGDHSAGLITSFRGGESTDTIDVDRRLGTRVTVRVSGEIAPAVAVQNVTTTYSPSWNPFEPGTLVLSYRLANTGNTLLSGTDASTAAGPFGAFAAASAPLVLSEVIPGSSIDVVREIPIAPWGWVSGTVAVQPEAIGLGAQPLAAVTHEYGVVAVPWTLLIAFSVIGVAVVVVWLVRRRRRAEPSDPQREQVGDVGARARGDDAT
ncbi:WxL protein peptidoglycan domain-containing protein [Microbacterium allomyrinae]|uniref:DUF916 domain-containing protein n=1 Tax=Microbacterium allomyrinae TaxID=2830666 RepID=A0A9X1S4C3_9MICO|nr:DUF916 domain-containing protein [Microbacterium allomyrinae]MCC2032923.1 DUF916 domain-containing protein [Microbacterium allomyrinae]